MEADAVPSDLNFMSWHNYDVATSLFKGALAKSMASFQSEIVTHYGASLQHIHGICKLQADASSQANGVYFDGNTTASDFALCQDTSQDDSHLSAQVDQMSLLGNKLKHDSRHPCQLMRTPVAPPPAPPPPVPHADAPMESCSDDEYNTVPSAVSSQRIACQMESLLSSATQESIRTALTPVLTLAMKRWEHIVHAYAFCDVVERVWASENVWVWEILPVWLHKDVRRGSANSLEGVRQSMDHIPSNDRSSITRVDDISSKGSFGCLESLVVEPCCDKRMLWALLGAVIILYDLIMIPMTPFVEWNSFTLRTLSLVSMIYWLLDLPLNFLVGYLDNGIVQMRPQKIFTNYLKSWFIPDLVLVSLDVFFCIVENSANSTTGAVRSAKTARVSRMFRFLRGVRLLRLIKLSQTFSYVLDGIQSEYQVLTLKLLAHLFIILGINHYVACGWFTIGCEAQRGLLFKSDSTSWIVDSGIDEAEPYYQYLMSLHWSVTQFTPATNNINPTCPLERAYAIVVVLFALVTFSSFVSSVTNTVNEMRRINMEKINEETKIREFILERSISVELAMRIWHFFRQNYMRSGKRGVLENDIRFFRGVPQSLLTLMREEMYLPVLRCHGVLNKLRKLDKIVVRTICHTSFAELFAVPNQDIFLQHVGCQRVIFHRGGILIYRTGISRRSSRVSFSGSGSTFSRDYPSQQVYVIDVDNPKRRSRSSWTFGHLKRADTAHWVSKCESGRWVSEPALWVTWRHCGQLSAESHADMIVLDCEKFHGIFHDIGGPLWQALKAVAVFFVEYAEQEMQNARPVTDISVDQASMEVLAQRSLTFQSQRNGILGDSLISPSVFNHAIGKMTPAAPSTASRLTKSASKLMGMSS